MNNRRTQPHANTNLPAAQPMDIYQIGIVGCFWLVYYAIIAAFVGSASPGMLTAAVILGWIIGIPLALSAFVFWIGYFDAEKHGDQSPQYAAVMTDAPMPPLAATVVSVFMLVIVSVTANDAGYHAMALLYMAIAILASAASVLRRAYHARIGR
jgi:hypothetical protein